jgi:hypothetical protein
VEQQGKMVEELNALWDHSFSDLADTLPARDEVIEAFNADSGVGRQAL